MADTIETHEIPEKNPALGHFGGLLASAVRLHAPSAAAGSANLWPGRDAALLRLLDPDPALLVGEVREAATQYQNRPLLLDAAFDGRLCRYR